MPDSCLNRIRILAFSLALTATAQADDVHPIDVWHGEWSAEDTPFSLRVVPAGNRFTVLPVQPAGLEWTASNGFISGNSGTIDVEYQGASAQVLVQLLSHDTAIVRSMSCQPDYHVICTLVRNQQARFIKRTSQN